MWLSKRKIKKYLNKGYDLNLLGRIEPTGNVNFGENDAYWKQGDGYYKLDHIPNDGYPQSGLRKFWLQDIMLAHGVNSFVAVEHGSNSKLSDQTTKAISNMLHTQNRKQTDDVDDKSKIQSLLDFRAALGNNVPVKEIRTSFYISGDSEEKLREKERHLKSKLNQFKIVSNDGMQDVEYGTAFIPASRQGHLPTRRHGQPISVVDLGAGYPFNHTTLMDTRGVYVGQTLTGGAVNFNLLQEDDIRSIPTMLIAGRDRTDKDKFLAKQLDVLFAKGHQEFNIDLNGILGDLTRRQGGKIIEMSGIDNDNYLNLMEVIATRSMKNSLNEDDQIGSFQDHREKLKAFAQIKNPELSVSDLNNLGFAIDELYTERGLWSAKAQSMKPSELLITKARQSDYPILANLVELLNSMRRQKESNNEIEEAHSYRRLFDAFYNLLQENRDLNRTSNFEDLSEEPVVTFDLSGIADTTLLNIQLYQILSLISYYAVLNGKRNQRIVEEGTDLEKDQLSHCIVTITGAERLFNRRYSKSLEFLARMIENISSNYAAVILEMSSLQDILISSNDTSGNDYVLATRKVFSATRYRLFSQLDELTIPLLSNALGGELTESELETLKYLPRGRFFLNIASVRNLIFEQQLSSSDDIDIWGMVYSEIDRYSSLR